MAPRRALNDRLETLQAELASSAKLSSEERARLEDLLVEARKHVAGDADEEPQSLSERLQEMTSQLEEEHPSLTFAIGAVADALSRLGI